MLVCASGCIQPTNTSPGSQPVSSSSHADTPVPAGQGSATPEPAPGTPAAAQISGAFSEGDNQTTENMDLNPKYSAGSSVQKNPGDSSYDRNHGWVIVRVNDDGTYTVGQIYFDPDVRVWFKVKEESLVTRAIHAVERDYPVLKGTVDWNTLPAKHGVVDQYGITSLEW
jgi:hypothetical protein